MEALKKAFRLWGFGTLLGAGAWACLLLLFFIDNRTPFSGNFVDWVAGPICILVLMVSGPSNFLALPLNRWWSWRGWGLHQNIFTAHLAAYLSAYLFSWIIILAVYRVPARRGSFAWFIKYGFITLVWVLCGVTSIYYDEPYIISCYRPDF
jgi:hypothetical protein